MEYGLTKLASDTITLRQLLNNITTDLQEDADSGIDLDMTLKDYLSGLKKEASANNYEERLKRLKERRTEKEPVDGEVTEEEKQKWEQQFGLTAFANQLTKQASYTRDGVEYGVSIQQDKDGYYAKTHRARSKSYPTPEQIPVKDLKFIDSTG